MRTAGPVEEALRLFDGLIGELEETARRLGAL